jgi:hypothetical protein
MIETKDGVCKLHPLVPIEESATIKRQAIFDKVFGAMEELEVIETVRCKQRMKDEGYYVSLFVDPSHRRGHVKRRIVGDNMKRFLQRKNPADLSFISLVSAYNGWTNGLNWVF